MDFVTPEQFRFIEASFDSKSVQRGLAYAKQGRVSFESTRWPLVATVQGNRLYTTSVSFDIDDKLLSGDCSCPVGWDCKHAAAIAFAFFHDQSLGAHKGIAEATNNRVCEWLAALGAAPSHTHLTKTTSKEVLYKIEHDSYWGGLEISLFYGVRRKRGGFGRVAPLHIFDGYRSIPNWLGPEDRTVLGSLWANLEISEGHGWLSLSAIPGAALKAVIDTGRCYFEDFDGFALSYGDARTAQLEWQPCPDRESHHELRVAGNLLIFGDKDLHYLDPASGTVGPLCSDYPPERVHMLAGGPSVPSEMLELVKGNLAEFLGDKETEINAPASSLLPSVSFRFEKVRRLQSLRVNAEAHYGADTFPLCAWNSDSQAMRNFVVEGKYSRYLDDMCEHYLPQDRSGWRIDFLNERECQTLARVIAHEMVPKLHAQGWRCELAEDFPVKAPELDPKIVEELVPTGQAGDWFSYEIGVEVGDQKLSLLPLLLQALRNGKIELFKELAQGNEVPGINLNLPGDALVHISGKRLSRWLSPLIELQLRGVDDQKQLRVPGFVAAEFAESSPSLCSTSEGLKKVRSTLAGLLALSPRDVGKGFEGELREYQKKGHGWLRFLHDAGYGGVLADDMGLGKTVQLLAFFDGLRSSRKLSSKQPALVVAPRSVVDNWHRETGKFTPKLKTLVHLGNKRAKCVDGLHGAHLILTSYQTMHRDFELLRSIEWVSLIFDESQAIKNSQTKLRRAASALSAQSRFCVTGTPIENHLGELRSQFDIAMPGLLGSEKHFKSLYRTPIEKNADSQALQDLQRRIRPFMLRRSKASVDVELPDKTEIIERVELPKAQRDLYESLRLTFDQEIAKSLEAKGVKRSAMVILDALLKLRQCCCDPRLVKVRGAKEINSSAKLERLMSMISQIAEESRHVLVFSQFTSMLSLIEKECKLSKIPYLKLTGATRKRDEVVRRFQDGEAPVFLISLKAGGTGLNLTRADTVIHYDPWWNPAAETQATDRAHRIGQDKHIFVYKMVAQGTLEERICELQAHKQSLSDTALLKGGVTNLSAEDLNALYRSVS